MRAQYKQMDFLQEIIGKVDTSCNRSVPKLNEEETQYLLQFADISFHRPMCVIDLRKDKEGEYINVFFLYLGQITRFLLSNNYTMEEAEMKKFHKWCMGTAVNYSKKALEKVFVHFKSQYPDAHLKYYDNAPLIMLAHIYHCFPNHHSIREVFLKAGLEYVALYDLEDINLIGGSPQGILEMPLNCIRSLNSKRGCEMILTEWGTRQYAKEIYLKNQNLFFEYEKENGKSICYYKSLNKFQLDYIRRLDYLEVEIKEDDINILLILENCEDEDEYSSYLRYLEIRSSVNEIGLLHFPLNVWNSNREDEYMRKADVVYRKMIEDEEFDEKIRKKYEILGEKYEYIGDNYSVQCFQSVKELLYIAFKLHNCLWGLLDSLVNSSTQVILAVIDNSSNKVIGILEIDKCPLYIEKAVPHTEPFYVMGLLQAKGPNNRRLSKEVQRFLLEEYGGGKKLYFRYCEDVFELWKGHKRILCEKEECVEELEIVDKPIELKDSLPFF